MMNSITNVNFVIDGVKSELDKSSSWEGFESFDDAYKNVMMDLFSPSLTTTDDILDKLIQELDKEQEASQELSDQDGHFFADNSPRSTSDPSLGSPIQIAYEQMSTEQPYQLHFPPGSYVPSYALQADGPINSTARSPCDYVQVTSVPRATISPTLCVKRVSSTEKTGLVGFSSADFPVVPPFCDTVEIEYSQEHSYATNGQQLNGPNGACLTSDVKRASLKQGVALSPTGSLRNSFASTCGNFPSKRSKYDRKSPLRQDYNYDVNVASLRNTFKAEKFDDEDDYRNECTDSSDFIGQSFVGAVDARSSNGVWLKRSSKRRCKSQFIPSFFDFRGDEKLPSLMLSDEERVLCEKEGIQLPTKFPLTKQEERELRRVRRKIRNKLSAQESRRKKNEYIVSLEQRVRACDQDNQSLRRQVEALSSSNKTLAEQLKRLQSNIGSGSTKQSVQAGTCLAVLLLSFALLVAPNSNLFGKQQANQDEHGGQFGLGHADQVVPLAANGRHSSAIKKAAKRPFIFPTNTRTLLPNVGDAPLGSSSYYNASGVADAAELDVGSHPFYFTDGGGGGGDDGNVRAKRSSSPANDSVDVKRSKSTNDGGGGAAAAAASSSAFVKPSQLSAHSAVVGVKNGDRFAAVVVDGDDHFSRRIGLTPGGIVDFGAATKNAVNLELIATMETTADRFGMMASSVERMAAVDWYDDRDDGAPGNRSAMSGRPVTSVVWAGNNRRLIKADDI